MFPQDEGRKDATEHELELGYELRRSSSVGSNTICGPSAVDSSHTIWTPETRSHHRSRNSKWFSEPAASFQNTHSISPKYGQKASTANFPNDAEGLRSPIKEPDPRRHSSQHQMRDKLRSSSGWKGRLQGYTWIFFQTSMATGGVSNVLHTVPFRFPGLDAIGTLFFLVNCFLFLMNCILISLRFASCPGTFKSSLTQPIESLFIPCSVLALGTLILNIAQYGLGSDRPWMETACVVLYWFYVGVVVLSSVSIYLIIWSTQTFDISNMTPTWIFPALPFLLVGPKAGYLSTYIEPSDRTSAHTLLLILVGGAVCQGIGFFITIFLYSAFYYRLMTQKLPSRAVRPAIFMSSGLNGFTCIAIVSMAQGAALVLPHLSRIGTDTTDILNGVDPEMMVSVLRVLCAVSVLPLYGLISWFFLICIGSYWHIFVPQRGEELRFSMAWLSFIFPNTPYVNGTFAVAEAFDLDPLRWVGCVLTVLLIGMWMFVFIMMIRAFIRKEIL